MKIVLHISIFVLILSPVMHSCTSKEEVTQHSPAEVYSEEAPTQSNYLLPEIDLSHWKVTLPIGNPTEVKPPEISDYANNPLLQEYMFNDSTDGSLVFYTYPGSTTRNSSYSRTELREQMVPGSNETNWTFAEGGKMRGSLKLENISRDDEGNFHNIMVMQIHARLTNSQREEIGKSDNDAPPVLKIYWEDGRIRVVRKVLKDMDINYPEILKKSSWKDDSHWFENEVGNDRFTIEIDVKGSYIKVTLNDAEQVIFDDYYTKQLGVFENYFKAGNYLLTIDKGAFSTVKYYELEVTH